MSEHVSKIVEIVGTSSESIEDAIRRGIARTSQTVRHLRWFEVTETRGHIVDGAVDQFQVTMKIGFSLEG